MVLWPHINTIGGLLAVDPASMLQKTIFSFFRHPTTSTVKGSYGIDTISEIDWMGTWFAGLCQLDKTLPFKLSLRGLN
jgi:hypothetical protein